MNQEKDKWEAKKANARTEDTGKDCAACGGVSGETSTHNVVENIVMEGTSPTAAGGVVGEEKANANTTNVEGPALLSSDDSDITLQPFSLAPLLNKNASAPKTDEKTVSTEEKLNEILNAKTVPVNTVVARVELESVFVNNASCSQDMSVEKSCTLTNLTNADGPDPTAVTLGASAEGSLGANTTFAAVMPFATAAAAAVAGPAVAGVINVPNRLAVISGASREDTETQFNTFEPETVPTPSESMRSIGSLVCRICHNAENPELLVSPCLCKGSLTYVHVHCLERWISTSRCTTCELCQFKYNTEQTLRYTLLQSLRLWYSRALSRRALQEDCQMFSLLTLVAFGIVGTLLVGIQYYSLHAQTWGLGKLWTKSWLLFFLFTTLVVYFANVYMLIKSQLSPWYRWWQSARDIKLILENRRPFRHPDRPHRPNSLATHSSMSMYTHHEQLNENANNHQEATPDASAQQQPHAPQPMSPQPAAATNPQPMPTAVATMMELQDLLSNCPMSKKTILEAKAINKPSDSTIQIDMEDIPL